MNDDESVARGEAPGPSVTTQSDVVNDDDGLSIRAAAAEHPDRVALVAGGAAITWRELGGRARGRDASELGPIAFRVARTAESIAEIYARIDRRAPFLPLPTSASSPDEPELRASISRLARPPLALVRTSGSTGTPKTACLSREAFLASAAGSAANLGFYDDDRWLLAMPLSHVGGLSILVRCLVARACVVLREDSPFDPSEVAARIARDRVTLASMVPTMLVRLLDAGWEAPPHLRAVLLGGAAASTDLLARADDRGIPVLTTYGLTETCSQVATQPYGTRNRGELGAGRPVRGAEICIEEDEWASPEASADHPGGVRAEGGGGPRITTNGGEILVRGAMLMDGYLDAPSPLTSDGFLRTGDLGELDTAGNLHVRGRLDDRIITGGENVDPLEVERVLTQHPSVHAACIVGLPDREWGERVAALVVADPDLTERDLLAWSRDHLPPAARPRLARFVPALPLTPSGKPDREAARRALRLPGGHAPGRRSGRLC